MSLYVHAFWLQEEIRMNAERMAKREAADKWADFPAQGWPAPVPVGFPATNPHENGYAPCAGNLEGLTGG